MSSVQRDATLKKFWHLCAVFAWFMLLSRYVHTWESHSTVVNDACSTFRDVSNSGRTVE